jgi:hypothetical protein
MCGEAFFGAAEMPLAPHAGGVALRREQLCDRDLPLRQPVWNASDWDFVRAGTDGESARDEGRTGRRALCFNIEIEQPRAFAGEFVDARRRGAT